MPRFSQAFTNSAKRSRFAAVLGAVKSETWESQRLKPSWCREVRIM